MLGVTSCSRSRKGLQVTRHWFDRTFHVKSRMSRTLYSYGTPEQVANIIRTHKEEDCKPSRPKDYRSAKADPWPGMVTQGRLSTFEACRRLPFASLERALSVFSR